MQTGRIVTNEKTGEKAWWDGKTLTPVNIKPGVNPADLQGNLTITDQPPPGNLPPPPTSTVPQPTTPEEQLVAGNRPLGRALEATGTEATQGIADIGAAQYGGLGSVLGALRLANAPAVGAGEAVGTTTQNVLAQIPGLGGASGVVPAAGAALANAATQLATGPKVFKTIGSGIKSVGHGISEIIRPGALRRAGSEAIAGKLGRAPSPIGQAEEALAQRGMFEAAKDVGEVPTKGLVPAVDKALNFIETRSGGIAKRMKGAKDLVQGLKDKLENNPTLEYRDIVDEIQSLRAEANAATRGARPNPSLMEALYKAREELLNGLDKISPAIREANKAYRMRLASDDVLEAVSSGNSGVALEKLIRANPGIIKEYGAKTMDEILSIAHDLSDVAGASPAGGFRVIMQAVAEPFGRMLASSTGRKILSKTFETTGGKTPQGLTIATQLWRNYETIHGKD